jgi:hypothetical protein
MASTWSSCDRATKIAVRSPNDSCSAPVCGGWLPMIQLGLSPSSTAWPVSCETMSKERQVNTRFVLPVGTKSPNFSAFCPRL